METHLHDLAIRQTGVANVNVIVANVRPRSEHCVSEGVSITRVARIGTVASMPLCMGLTAAIRHKPADLVHIHMPNPGVAFAFLMSGHSGKLVITHHADTLGREVLRKLSDPFVNRVMERAARIIVTSKRYCDSSGELKPFHGKCDIVPLGIDCKRDFKNDPPIVQDLRLRFGEKIILAVGRLVPYKGFDILIRAMKHIEAKLLLIGTGPQRESLARLAAGEGIERKVEFLGRVENLDPYFAAASLFSLPSVTRAEAFGLVQLEAMAAGLPIVNTNIDSGVPEVSLDGQTGITVPAGDVTALASAMLLLLGRKDLREKFGNAARTRARAEYTADLMSQRTLRVYEEVLGGEFNTTEGTIRG
jgi:glycosyltransferase involved in cell wall biosynthesis